MAANLNWTPPEPLSSAPLGSRQVTITAVGATVHAVWELGKTLYHSSRLDGEWQAPVKIAAGEQPSLAAAADGTLYCAHANWFRGNRDIYLTTYKDGRWTLPQRVSRTPGESSDPAVCVGPDGAVHLVWADATPGYPVIYYGLRDPKGWIYAPIPNGKGSAPAIAASPAAVYVAWQDRLASSTRDVYEVMVAVKRSGEWDLPAIVSDTPEIHSLLPRIAASASDRCHLVWQEERDSLYVVRHADLWPNGWDAPVDVSDGTADARLGAAVANKTGSFQFVWAEGALIKHRVRSGEPHGAWWQPEVACEDCAGLGELTAVLSADGALHVIFSRTTENSETQLFYLRRKAIARSKVLLPMIHG